MRKLLNTLYVTTPEAYLSKDGLNVVVSVDKEELFRIPVMNIRIYGSQSWINETLHVRAWIETCVGVTWMRTASRRPPCEGVD